MTRSGLRVELWAPVILGLVAFANALMGDYLLATAEFLVVAQIVLSIFAQDRWNRRWSDWPLPARIVNVLVGLVALLFVAFHWMSR